MAGNSAPDIDGGRRAELADAALRVVAREGSRGLTHRAVDEEAGVPTGTASLFTAPAGRAEIALPLRPRRAPARPPHRRPRPETGDRDTFPQARPIPNERTFAFLAQPDRQHM